MKNSRARARSPLSKRGFLSYFFFLYGLIAFMRAGARLLGEFSEAMGYGMVSPPEGGWPAFQEKATSDFDVEQRGGKLSTPFSEPEVD